MEAEQLNDDELRNELQNLREKLTPQQLRFVRQWFEDEEFQEFGRIGGGKR